MKRGQSQSQTYEQDMNQEQLSSINSANLPARQNIFSKMFSNVRAKFAKLKVQSQDMDSSYEKSKASSSQSEEKKSWELEPEEKARIQKETAEIAKRQREQEEKQSQQNMQNQSDTQMIQGQVTQQPMMDMGGMEL